MAKRRRKKPNIPQSALEQARQDANEDDVSSQSGSKVESEAGNEVAQSTVTNPATVGISKASRRRRSVQTAQLEKRKNQGSLDAEYVAEMLANPTKVVTEEDLHADYGFVITDLRNMGILATVLFVALVGISLVIL